jgi:hypothetical protein
VKPSLWEKGRLTEEMTVKIRSVANFQTLTLTLFQMRG